MAAPCDPTTRFTGLAETYARNRPTYPDAAIQEIIDRGRLGPESLLVDIGCGTGIASRQFASRGVPVLGIEPNGDMRARAQAGPVAQVDPRPRYQEGRAEATGLPPGVADVVLAAQAFHWFEPGAAFTEFHRILRPGGWVALLWNERDESDAFTRAYGDVMRTRPDVRQIETTRGEAGRPLLTCPLFRDGVRLSYANRQSVDREGLLGRAFSTSYAPRHPEAAEPFARALEEVFAGISKTAPWRCNTRRRSTLRASQLVAERRLASGSTPANVDGLEVDRYAPFGRYPIPRAAHDAPPHR
jgi:SAM-dependent methyltransferase